MIPRVCANCVHGLVVMDNGNVAFGVCVAHATRVFIDNPGGYTCGVDFSMMDNPNYVIPDQNVEMDAEDFVNMVAEGANDE